MVASKEIINDMGFDENCSDCRNAVGAISL